MGGEATVSRKKPFKEGELVKVFEDSRHRVYWFQPAGVRRELFGTHIFLDSKARTSATIQGGPVVDCRRSPGGEPSDETPAEGDRG